MPSRFSVLFPSPLLHASRGQAWSPRARTKQSLPSRFSQSPVCVFQTRQSLPSRFSQSLVCFFLSLEQHDPISAMWARRVLPPCLLHASRRQNVASSSKHDPICATSVGSVKVLCVFFLSLERARSHLCQVVSVCYSHLVCSTHLVDKRGSLEQERSSLYHLGSVKVLCVFFKRGNLYHLGLVKVLCVCFFFKPRATRSHLCHVGSACSSILFAPRISRTNVAPSSKHESVFTMSVESKCCVCFS